MGSTVTLNENSTVCRTCLKVLDTSGFTYIDDESGYVKNVGNVREMMQFCIPELDLYVSSNPVICYQCLPVLVQVYNFKIKCLNGENIIKAYMSRNNLQDYNQVNLNCVLMDDLKMKSQKIQIESKIKQMMLKELPETEVAVEAASVEPVQDAPQQVVNEETNAEEVENNSRIEMDESELDDDGGESQEDSDDEDSLERDVKIEFEELMEMDAAIFNDHEVIDEAPSEPVVEPNVEVTKDSTENEEPDKEKQLNIVAVRKDLFDNNNQTTPEEAVTEPKTQLIINNGFLQQNGGRIVIKIDRKRLQALTEIEPKKINSNSVLIAPLSQTVKIVSTGQGSSESTPLVKESSTTTENPTKYDCNKCSFSTTDVIKMYEHNKASHSFDYTCQHCPFSTSKVELLGKHMTMVHPQNMIAQKAVNFKVSENYACSLCPFSVRSMDLLRSHHMTAHGNVSKEKGPIVLNSAFNGNVKRSEPKFLRRLEYICDICPYSTKDKSNLRKHLFTHGTKPLKCDHCSYKCVSPYQLRRHQKQKHVKLFDPRPRNQPYELPDLKKEKEEAMDKFKITLETIKRELEKERAATS